MTKSKSQRQKEEWRKIARVIKGNPDFFDNLDPISNVSVNPEEWIKYAQKHNADLKIIKFIKSYWAAQGREDDVS